MSKGAWNAMQELYKQIIKLGKKYDANKIILFGSRARGDHKDSSDIDLAVYGMPEEKRAYFWSEIEELPTLLEIDIVYITDNADKQLIDNIEKDGLILMNRITEKHDKFKKAVDRLQESIEEYEQCELLSSRDGVIQRFEFCIELLWKVLKIYLEDQGYQDVYSPKAVMKKAFLDGVIKDEQVWIQLLEDRNRTSHIYDEAAAEGIYKNIRNRYIIMFNEISHVLDEKIAN